MVRKPSIVAILGSIMPEPLAMPPTVTGPFGVSITAAHDFGNGSVVMMARVAFVPPSTDSAAAAAATPAFTLSRFERHANHAGG